MSSDVPGPESVDHADHADHDERAEPVGPARPARSVPPAARPSGLVFDDPLDRPAADDTDHGWGDRTATGAGDLARFLDEKPPHHI